MLTKLKFLILCAILSVASTRIAHAHAVYAYTGNNLTFPPPPYAANDHVSIEMEFLNALTPNLPFGSVAPLSFSFSDGHQTITSFAFGGQISVATNADGSISEWDLQGCGNAGCVHQVISRSLVGNVRDAGQLVPQGVQEGILDNDPSVWIATISNVPEPSSLILGAAALTGVGWFRRRRGVLSSVT